MQRKQLREVKLGVGVVWTDKTGTRRADRLVLRSDVVDLWIDEECGIVCINDECRSIHTGVVDSWRIMGSDGVLARKAAGKAQ